MIFKLASDGTETVLHNFSCDLNDQSGASSLIQDAAGSFYGTTALAGSAGLGAVFQLDASGVFTELYSFTGGTDGAVPSGPLFLDAATGNLFGTASLGGVDDCVEVSPSGTESVVHSFTAGGNGSGLLPG